MAFLLLTLLLNRMSLGARAMRCVAMLLCKLIDALEWSSFRVKVWRALSCAAVCFQQRHQGRHCQYL